jgi:outer membrane protein assembly factor BamB
VSGRHVIFGGGFGSHDVYALDLATGTLRWNLHTSDDGPTAAVVLDGLVLLNTESCTLLAADAESGRLSWEHWLGDPLLAQPAAANGRVVMAYPRGGEHYLAAFDVRTGSPLWETLIGHDVITAPVIAEGQVYMSTFNGAVTAVDVRTGRIRWSKAMNATSAPFVWNGTVYVANRNGGTDSQPADANDSGSPHQRGTIVFASERRGFVPRTETL